MVVVVGGGVTLCSVWMFAVVVVVVVVVEDWVGVPILGEIVGGGSFSPRINHIYFYYLF